MSPVKTWSTPVNAEKKQLIPCKLCGGHSFKASLSCEGFSYVRCVSCGLVQMNPQPLAEEIQRRYHGEDYLAYELANEEPFLNLQLLALKDAGFDDIEKEIFTKSTSTKDFTTNHTNHTNEQKKDRIQQVRSTLREVRGKKSLSIDLGISSKPRVLDIGCAIGSLLARLRDRGWETTGVEISGPQAEYCRQKRALDVRSLPLEENRFAAGAFNVVLASHLIEHLNDPAAFVREVRRILVPGGRFFVTTPNIAGFQARLFASRWRSAIFDHLYLFSVKTLSRLLGENGFTIEKIATWGGLAAGTAPPAIKRIFDKAAKRFDFGDVMIIRANN